MIPSFPALARGITDIARACLFAAGDDVEHHEVQSKLDNFVKNLMLQMERSGFNYRKWHKDMLSDYKWLGGELVGTALDPLMKNGKRQRQMPRCGEWGVDLFGDTIAGMPRGAASWNRYINSGIYWIFGIDYTRNSDDMMSHLVVKLGLCSAQPNVDNLCAFCETLGVPCDITMSLLRWDYADHTPTHRSSDGSENSRQYDERFWRFFSEAF